MLLAAQGISYCGPEGSISFEPRIQPEDHRSFFSTAEGWGTFSQKRTATQQVNALKLRYGSLVLKTCTFHLPQGVQPKSVAIRAGGKSVLFDGVCNGTALTIQPKEPIVLLGGQKFSVEVEW